MASLSIGIAEFHPSLSEIDHLVHTPQLPVTSIRRCRSVVTHRSPWIWMAASAIEGREARPDVPLHDPMPCA
jgi:hypothetical protein